MNQNQNDANNASMASSMQAIAPAKERPEKSSSSKSANKPFQRRRARRACIACHERKVRCDVLQRQPCTNCEQDRCKCVVRPHKNRRASVAALELANQPEDGLGQDDYEDSPGLESIQDSPSNVHPPNGNGQAFAHRPPMHHHAFNQGNPFAQDQLQARPGVNPWFDPSGLTLPYQGDVDGMSDFNQPLPYNFDPLFDADTTALTGLESVFNTTPNPNFASPQNYQSFAQPSPPTSLGANDTVSSPTLGSMDLTGAGVVRRCFGDSDAINMDREYLRSQGCFQLPAAPVFNGLMRAYFTYVHPNLPVINEADFWALWPIDDSTFQVGNFSILVLQSMAFAATSFASTDVLEQCGFHSARKARLTFHKRAKLLFDMEVESDPVCMSQSALLLTYYVSSSVKFRVNTLWLTHAIRFAQVAGADRFYELKGVEPKQLRMLKRLWWGCIVRDRIMPLGLRRPIQIRESIPVRGDQRFLSEVDFQDEMGMSRVHDPAAQARIFQIVNLMCKFSESLTPAMITLYAAEKPRDRAVSTPDTLQSCLTDVKTHIEQLYLWHESAVRVFPPPVSLDDESAAVTIYANLLWMYYDAAILALCNHALILWETRGVPASQHHANMFELPLTEISNAVADTTERMKELLQSRLAQHLPISVSAYLCLPLLLYALSVKASSTEAEGAVSRRQLSIYSRSMRLQQNLYDGTDYVFDIIQNIEKYADEERLGLLLENENANESSRGSSTPKSSTPNVPPKPLRQPFAWRGLLLRKPRLYLRLVLHVDVALCEGMPPQEHDFPTELRRS